MSEKTEITFMQTRLIRLASEVKKNLKKDNTSDTA